MLTRGGRERLALDTAADRERRESLDVRFGSKGDIGAELIGVRP
jgi:hypothetical protein